MNVTDEKLLGLTPSIALTIVELESNIFFWYQV